MSAINAETIIIPENRDIERLNEANKRINEGKIFKIDAQGKIAELTFLERVMCHLFLGVLYVNKMISYAKSLTRSVYGQVEQIYKESSLYPGCPDSYLKAVQTLIIPKEDPSLANDILKTKTLANEILLIKEAEKGSVILKERNFTLTAHILNPVSEVLVSTTLSFITNAASWLYNKVIGSKESEQFTKEEPELETGENITQTAEPSPNKETQETALDYSNPANLPDLDECLNELPIQISEEQKQRGVTSNTIKEHLKFQMEYFKGIGSGRVTFSGFGGLLKEEGKKVEANGKEVRLSVTLFDSWTFMLKSKVLHYLFASPNATSKTAHLFFNGIPYVAPGFYEQCGDFFKKEVCQSGKITQEGGVKLKTFYNSFQFSDLQAATANGFIEKGQWNDFIRFLVNNT